MSFFLEMILHPELQHKAQEELDRVVGRDRLPTFADRESLPYIEALIREVYRVYPVAPLGERPGMSLSMMVRTNMCAGVPHVAEEDDIYDGMFISKGTAILANIWYALPRAPTQK